MRFKYFGPKEKESERALIQDTVFCSFNGVPSFRKYNVFLHPSNKFAYSVFVKVIDFGSVGEDAGEGRHRGRHFA